MQQECTAEGARSRYERRKPSKVLKIAESFTNLDETAKAGRFVRGPNSKLGRRLRDGLEGSRTKRAVCCDDDCDKESGVSEDCERLGDRRVTGSSCTALRTAVAALYPFDDFILEKIGSGFFSEVFKMLDYNRPRRRWRDDLDTFAGKTWPEIALDRAAWKVKGEAFAQEWDSITG